MNAETNGRLKGEVSAVSLGPGDPELITVRGLNVLKAADKIYFPGSQFSDGRQDSYSRSILNHYELDAAKLEGFYLKMSLDRTEARALYQTTFQRIKADYEQGLKIAVVSEGDASTYSSFSYLLEHLQDAGIPVRVVPGITSYALTAAGHQVPLSIQQEQLAIHTQVESAAELEESLAQFDTVVLMKIRSQMPVIIPVLEQLPVAVFYGERMGTDQEFISQDLEEIKTRAVPYFALMIIKINNATAEKKEERMVNAVKK